MTAMQSFHVNNYESFQTTNRSSEFQVCFVSDLSPELQSQYFNKRDDWMRKHSGLEQFSGLKDKFDDRSFVVVALKGDSEIVGGVRITLGDTQSSQFLPSEMPSQIGNPSFSFKDYFPKQYNTLELVGEISRLFVISSNIQKNSDLVKRMLDFLFSKQAEVHGDRTQKVKYVYCRTSKAHAIIYMRVMKRLGIPYTYRFLESQAVPRRMQNWMNSYGGVCVISCDISKVLSTNSHGKLKFS